ncbi:N-acetylmuramoyl-L-alanine amidase [Bacillus sp. PAMC26568]|nr:N-acetylmuramoyl-L-alanine amidase [Bacillus sp. PAMC26568]
MVQMPEKTELEKEKGQRGAEQKYIRETNRTNRGVKKGKHYMTKVSNHVPSVLVEGGFMANKKAAALLKSDAYR